MSADQRYVAPTLPFTAPDPVEIFAVGDRHAQVVWRSLGPGTVVARLEDRIVPLGDADRVGAAVVPELMPDRVQEIAISVDDRPVRRLRLRTAPSLGGSWLTRIATIGDLHLGEPGFGLVKRMNEPRTVAEGYPLRCATAALEEAVDWGAGLIVVKGDITDDGRPEEWNEFDRLLERARVPVIAIPGNHDVSGHRHSTDAGDQLRQRELFPSRVQVLDDGAVRVVIADSTVPGRGYGRLSPVRAELEGVVAIDRPVLLLTHHHLESTPLPWFWPLGAPRHDGFGVLDRLLNLNPDIFVSSGHTHRNRVGYHRSAIITEVGSVKDHPGVWAGYELSEVGIRQTIHRVARPDCIDWTERTRAAVGGVWGRWSPGAIADRCVTHRWTRSDPAVRDGYELALESPMR